MSLSSQLIDGVLKGKMSLFLKRQGFRKDGRTFYKRSDGLWLIVNVQASQGDSWSEARFYVNLAVYSPLLAAEQGLSPTDRPKEYQGQRRERLEPDHQGWWVLTPTADVTETSAEIAFLLEHNALPWLERAAQELSGQG